jgi:hypothetical protein
VKPYSAFSCSIQIGIEQSEVNDPRLVKYPEYSSITALKRKTPAKIRRDYGWGFSALGVDTGRPSLSGEKKE